MTEILRLEAITKNFPGVEVLKAVSFRLEKGNIYGLVGENGAGKSTLVKMLMGLHQPDSGDIYINGKKALIKDPSQARNRYKIDTVFQEHALIPQLSVAENLYLDKLDQFYQKGLIDHQRLHDQANQTLHKIDLKIDTRLAAGQFAEAEKSLIELAKALSRDPDILILDEMTAPLESSTVNDLLVIMRDIKQKGKTFIFISHRLEEVFRICDHIMVLRDGNFEGIIENDVDGDYLATRKKIIGMMTGTEKGLSFPERAELKSRNQKILSVKGIENRWLKKVSLDVYKGEIVALAGLRGQGQNKLLRTIAGLLPKDGGEIDVSDKSVKIKHPRHAFGNGIFYISDKRDEEELWLTHSVWFNMSMASINDRFRHGLINLNADRQVVEQMSSRLKVETPSLAQIVKNLSGGNRQKVVLGKYLLAKPKILLLDQPTMGLDVGAKTEIYKLLRKLAAEGIPTLAVLTELEEVVNLPDRLLIMREGNIVREFSETGVSEAELLDSYYG